jgi:hypothetical protein
LRIVGYLGRVETMVVLSPLVLLFTAFVIIQFTYLFGGTETIEVTGGLTRAQYARQGFFQLVVVASLVTVLILALDWAFRRKDQRDRTVTGMFVALVLLTSVMVVSALVRMKLYVDAFGLSELRLYTTAFMAWIAALLVLLLVTVLRGRRRSFALGALLAGVLVVAVLNVVNPDALIARVNIDRHVQGGVELDTAYLGRGLSLDAVPVVVDRLSDIPDPCVRFHAATAVSGAVDSSGGWRSYHWGRTSAQDALADLAIERPPNCQP